MISKGGAALCCFTRWLLQNNKAVPASVCMFYNNCTRQRHAKLLEAVLCVAHTSCWFHNQLYPLYKNPFEMWLQFQWDVVPFLNAIQDDYDEEWAFLGVTFDHYFGAGIVSCSHCVYQEKKRVGQETYDGYNHENWDERQERVWIGGQLYTMKELRDLAFGDRFSPEQYWCTCQPAWHYMSFAALREMITQMFDSDYFTWEQCSRTRSVRVFEVDNDGYELDPPLEYECAMFKE